MNLLFHTSSFLLSNVFQSVKIRIGRIIYQVILNNATLSPLFRFFRTHFIFHVIWDLPEAIRSTKDK